jgi:hypothetical protein
MLRYRDSAQKTGVRDNSLTRREKGEADHAPLPDLFLQQFLRMLNNIRDIDAKFIQRNSARS